MTTPSHRRRSRPRRHTAPLAAVAVAAVALVVSLAVAFRPGGGTNDVPDAAKAVSGARTSAPPTPGTPSPSGSPSPSASSASPTAGASASHSATATATASKAAQAKTTTATAPKTSTTGSLAGRIRPGTTYRGVATSYDSNGDGACLFGPSSDVMNAAMNTTDYETAKACGAFVAVHAGGKSITVRITNECPAPCQPGQLDLSQQAFAKLAPLSAGRIAITWNLVSPATAGTISIRYKTGSSQYWCGIQAIGHRNPLARLEVRTGGGWTRLERTGYNYFLSEHGAGCGAAIRLTDIYGQRLTVDGIAVKPNVVQSTSAQFARH
ncbi:expansin EXLX1 family cellulose-binding protein [Streptomyces sp. DSM 15324]|uniref:expansin EXLX1 family cellulose-binding protein n=1 Tax=Streptomyces sp. DSM 15324 TaxID=1739111 RepID=UPI00074AABED|nr:expansin EXLX1 family cellulose-binding protein [Streptomyces sp. DSM 15324]KUO10873.1 hypothetical protein AQJ58_18305 [Streptomyces sp. DSM 15324]